MALGNAFVEVESIVLNRQRRFARGLTQTCTNEIEIHISVLVRDVDYVDLRWASDRPVSVLPPFGELH